MTVMRVTLRTSRGELAHWSYLIGLSFALHLAAGVALVFLPMVFRPKLKFPQVYTVDLMSLPAGAPGPRAGGPEAPPVAKPSPPAPKAAPPVAKPAVKAPAPPPKLKAAIKIPEKPTAKSTKPKPAEKTKETPKPVPEESKETAAETDSEKPGSEGASKSSEKPASGSQAPIAGLSSGGQGSGEGAAGAGGGGAGGMLDDATFQYGWYLSNMSGLFSRNWTRPVKPDLSATLRAIVHFRIQKDGKLSDIVLEQSSGDAALDRSALRAVQDSNPLPPLPYQYGKDSLGVHFFFDLVPD